MLARSPLVATLVAAAVFAVPALTSPAFAQEEPVTMKSEVLDSFVILEVNQAVGVDAEHFYVVDNTLIAKYTKDTKELVLSKDYEADGAIHFDSAAVIGGKISCCPLQLPGVADDLVARSVRRGDARASREPFVRHPDRLVHLGRPGRRRRVVGRLCQLQPRVRQVAGRLWQQVQHAGRALLAWTGRSSRPM